MEHITQDVTRVVEEGACAAVEDDSKRRYVGHDSEQLRVVPSLEDLERCMVGDWRSDVILI